MLVAPWYISTAPVPTKTTNKNTKTAEAMVSHGITLMDAPCPLVGGSSSKKRRNAAHERSLDRVHPNRAPAFNPPHKVGKLCSTFC